ncbi:hypothetical protein ANANG_G00005160 [Anguilla anguilla]|uniref:IRG-type G domain-containing protein n=1 Tax=Anguilla anguilla TaxID=7936 RepID=A0A9D3S948_ANGAN|nr:hypothetical protein ANANG_G00005160 [Anguilla anguilla]
MARLQTISEEEIQEMSSSLQSRVVTEVVVQVKVWDLPGIGTPNFKADEYLQKVEFQRYDFFIIIISERFKVSNVQLATEIQHMKKRFYFVRSKIDNSIDAEKRKKGFDKDKTLSLIRQDCIKVSTCSSTTSCSWRRRERELPKHKQRVLLLSLPNITLDINQRKKEALQANIWKMALLSGAIGTVPIPGVSMAVDEISADVVIKLLTKFAGAGLMLLEYWVSTIPVFGSMAAAGISRHHSQHADGLLE